MLWESADGATLLAVAGLSAIATAALVAVQRRWLMLLILLALTTLLSCLWQGYWAAVYRLVEPVVLVSLLGGWLLAYRRWGGGWGLAVLGLLLGLGYSSTGDMASWLPLLWGAGLGAMLLPGVGIVAIAISTLSDQGLYAVFSHSPLTVAATKLVALVVFSGVSGWLRHRYEMSK
ncbi:MAG: hypothetical protein HC926_03845 [Synechococcaceae cyanobacterium SM2_3_60]|nr:hypothetical protein [Synechococcaceae cyanobacterium SM2_3_60]